MRVMEKTIEEAYESARERFAEFEVDTGQVLQQLDKVPISIQCWQGDDVLGFENPNQTLTGGIQTTGVADKISTCLCFLDEILLHVSRPVRWDSDHVVLLDDATIAVAQEIVRSKGLDRVHIGLDYFDASINRITA